MRTSDSAHAMSLAAEVAALLPPRHGAGWTFAPAPAAARPAARLSNGPRHLLLTPDGGSTMLATGTPDPGHVSLTVAGSAPAAVAGAALRSLLPRIDDALAPPPARRSHRLDYLAEVAARLRELGASPTQFERADHTTALAWQLGDAAVHFSLHGTRPTGAVGFAGRLGAIEQFLPPYPGPGRVRATAHRGCGGVARRIVAVYPHAVETDADGLVRFTDPDGGPLQGWVMPRDVNGPTGPRTPVTAGVTGVGVDLILFALPTLT